MQLGNTDRQPQTAKDRKMIQRRAKTGGESGANGEWYEGGKFIATTDHAKGKPAKQAKTRKMEVAPYNWQEQPTADHVAIYSYLGGFTHKYNHTTGKLEACGVEATDWQIELAEAFNNGSLWGVRKDGKIVTA